MTGLLLYNTRSRCKERFEPLEPDHARVYSCGPTVYAPQHIGNLRPYLMADLLRRGRYADEVMNILVLEEVQKIQKAMELAHPNDPCPCGSGRKFRKCHGRRHKISPA